MKFAAIDIGSNAMRLLITNIVEQPDVATQFNKSALIRVPIRLGQDAFTVGEISEENIDRMIDAMKAFKLLMKVYKVEKYKACATSAMREAYNGNEVVDIILEKSEIEIEIIDGKKEAAIIASSDLHNFIKTDQTYLYVDVGGGSTEITILSKHKIIAAKSFKIGTIRLLNDMVTKECWQEMKDWVKSQTYHLEHVEMIGSGGNINKIAKLIKGETPQPILYYEFKAMRQTLMNMSYDQRIKTFQLNPDRADVIVPASKIYYSVMKWADSSILHVPRIGLSDGIVQLLHERYLKTT